MQPFSPREEPTLLQLAPERKYLTCLRLSRAQISVAGLGLKLGPVSSKSARSDLLIGFFLWVQGGRLLGRKEVFHKCNKSTMVLKRLVELLVAAACNWRVGELRALGT